MDLSTQNPILQLPKLIIRANECLIAANESHLKHLA